LLTCFKADLAATLIHDFNKLSKLEQSSTLYKMMMEFSGKWWQWKGSTELTLVAVAVGSISCLWGTGNGT
jgi:hypothetical protein